MKFTPLTSEYLRSVLHYDPDTGKWTWIVRSNARVTIGREAGYVRKDGYRVITLGGQKYNSSVLVVFYMTGDWPPEGHEVDHKNLIRGDDRWENLRIATKAQNAWNTGMRPNKTGYKGVTQRRKKFGAQIRVHNKYIHLGMRDTAEEAHELYKAKALELYGEFARRK